MLRFWRRRSPRTAVPGGAAAVPDVRFSFFFYVSVFSFSSPPSLLSVCFSFLCFFSLFFSPLGFSLLSVLPLSLLCFFCFSPSSRSLFSSLRFLFFFFLSPHFLSAFLASIYRGQGRCFFTALMGEQPAGRPLGVAAEVRWVVRGGWSAIVSGRWAPGERVAGKIQIKASLSPSSPLRDRGEEDEQCRFKTTPFCSFLFFFLFLNV